MKPATLSTFELKERGWTPAMIRDLLGPHDRERKSELRVGSRDRLTDGIVKLYLEDRVVQAETTEAFATAQDRARIRQDTAAKGVETRLARHAAQLAQHAAVEPVLKPHPEAATMTREQLWRGHYLMGYYEWLMDQEHLLQGLPHKKRREAENAAYSRYHAAFEALYGDREWNGLPAAPREASAAAGAEGTS